MKIYIAGKITGLENYRDIFADAERKLTAEGHICMNPAVLGEGFPWDVYMPICYAMIDACDTIYMLNNWKDSKGAKLELEYAKKNNKTIMYQEESDKEIESKNYLEIISELKDGGKPAYEDVRLACLMANYLLHFSESDVRRLLDPKCNDLIRSLIKDSCDQRFYSKKKTPKEYLGDSHPDNPKQKESMKLHNNIFNNLIKKIENKGE